MAVGLWMSGALLLALLAGSCDGKVRTKRRWSGDFKLPFFQDVDDVLSQDLNGILNNFGDAGMDVSNTLKRFDEVLNWNNDQFSRNQDFGATDWGNENARLQDVGFRTDQTLTLLGQKYGADQNLQQVQQQLDDVLNFDVSNLMAGIGKLLEGVTQKPVENSNAEGLTVDCLEGNQFLIEIRQLFDSFGQSPGMQEFMQIVQQMILTMQRSNPTMASDLQKFFLSGDVSLQQLVDAFVSGRPDAAIETVLKTMKLFSETLDMGTLNTVLGEIQSVSTDPAIQLALDNIQFMLNGLASDQEVSQTFQEILQLVQDGKAVQSLASIADMLPAFLSEPQLVRVLEMLSTNPNATKAFGLMQLLMENNSSWTLDSVRVIQDLESMLTVLADNERILEVFGRLTQRQAVIDAWQMVTRLFDSTMSSSSSVGQVMLALNDTIIGLTTHWDLLQTLLYLSVNQDAVDVLETIILLFRSTNIMNPEINQAILYTAERLRDVLSNQELLHAIQALNGTPEANLSFETVMAMLGNSTVHGSFSPKFTAIQTLFTFFPTLLETIQNDTTSLDETQLLQAVLHLLGTLNTTNSDKNVVVSAMASVLNDLVQNTEILSAFVNFANNPNTDNGVVFILLILGDNTFASPTPTPASPHPYTASTGSVIVTSAISVSPTVSPAESLAPSPTESSVPMSNSAAWPNPSSSLPVSHSTRSIYENTITPSLLPTSAIFPAESSMTRIIVEPTRPVSVMPSLPFGGHTTQGTFEISPSTTRIVEATESVSASTRPPTASTRQPTADGTGGGSAARSGLCMVLLAVILSFHIVVVGQNDMT